MGNEEQSRKVGVHSIIIITVNFHVHEFKQASDDENYDNNIDEDKLWWSMC